MINQYKYTGQSDKETLYDATGYWNDQLSGVKAPALGWGWDATESHQSIETQTVTSDDPDVADVTETTYSFEVAVYRKF